MKTVRLGVIGLSDGNGHPYSWSAIFNGYNPSAMANCGFPVIPEYLSHQKFPEDCIPNAHVTHVWTQDESASRHIAAAANIPNVVDRAVDMIGHVDAILLARDDPENHYEMARPFIEAGLPIYIDKPLAVSREEAKRIYALERYQGQVFTCSALAYSDGVRRDDVGELYHLDATCIKDWKKYAIHVIEPALRLFDYEMRIVRHNVMANDKRRIVTLEWENGLTTTFKTLSKAKCGFRIALYGTDGVQSVDFGGTFFMFRNALREFVSIVRGEKMNDSRKITMKAIEILERGLYE